MDELDKLIGTPLLGDFQVSTEKITGQLNLLEEDSELRLNSDKPVQVNNHNENHILGLLSNNTHVSLFDCLQVSSTITGVGAGAKTSSTFLPRYAIVGSEHIQSDEQKISSIRFLIEDADVLLQDLGVFGQTISIEGLNEKEFIKSISEKSPSKFEVGDHPLVFYYSGKTNILSVETELGRISASHRPSFISPSSKGISVTNKIPLEVYFENPVTFSSAIETLDILRGFLDLILGRPQNVQEIHVELESDDEYPMLLEVHDCMKQKFTYNDRRPHVSDILILASKNTDQFNNVLKSWTDSFSEMRDSRFRFKTSFSQQNNYSADRLIAAANTFDIMPKHKVGTPPLMPDEIKQALDATKKTFKGMPKSTELRDHVLSTLGRIGALNLRDKVKNRAKIIKDELPDRFPDLENIIDEAINTRNYFVHGTEGKLNSEGRYELMFAFTDTLEFVFAASDLIECGWEIKPWASGNYGFSHKFSGFLQNYPRILEKFRQLMPQGK